ncbi:DUF3693 domain-containing protein [Xanthomonas citri]|uniref:DUF3693 domain-containing protein n=1 Tax=Xanthomonas citri TaxID=346 RepID=UPI000A2FD3D0|nr:DUF3693 domain-containing protein [Xanthomonas citri]ARR23712.1 hypothetical protein B7L67_20940 [Xanthomonas citri pv. citri]
MQTINKLLDTALKACNEPSDRQLAKHLDVSPSAISLWRKGKPIKDDHLMALIHLAQADPAIAVLVRTEGAESPEAKKAWSVVWDRLSPVTTVIGALALVAIGMHAGTHEALLTALSPVALTAPSIHYAKLAVLTLLCALAAYHCWSLHRKRTGQ